jgi:hypothetical protein
MTAACCLEHCGAGNVWSARALNGLRLDAFELLTFVPGSNGPMSSGE